ncbi:MAG: 3D domain-containing protein [Candidatus Cloacimonetes bacterium]|nr:3D domain-containing protein [Candidatus Cloacimonadota bacterium]
MKKNLPSFIIGCALGIPISLFAISHQTQPNIYEPIVQATEQVDQVITEPRMVTTIHKEFIQEEQIEQNISLGKYTITAYCSCEICCGKWAKNRPNGIVYGAAGIELVSGISVASPLPLGTSISIEGLGEYIVQDRTADWVSEKYDSKIIDIYFNNHEEAAEFGKQIHEIFIEKGE